MEKEIKNEDDYSDKKGKIIKLLEIKGILCDGIEINKKENRKL